MSKTEIQKVLTVDTKNSQATVKALKDEILKLNAELQNANTNSSKLQTSTSQLGDALDNSAGDAKQLDTSYNSLVNTMKNLKKEWRATTDEMERNNLGGKIIEVNSKLKEMDATIGNFQRNVGNYPKTFGQQMSEMSEQLQPTISKFDAIQKTAAGLTSGIAALTGTMALLGIENEDVQKSLLKVQSAMAIAQGVGGLKDLFEGLSKGKVAFAALTANIKGTITSLNGLKLALASTGIGLLIVAIGTLIYYFSQLNNINESTKKNIEQLNKRLEESLKVIGADKRKGTLEALTLYKQALEDAGTNTEKLKKATDEYSASLKKLKEQSLKEEIDTLIKEQLKLQNQKKELEKAAADYENSAWNKGVKWVADATGGALGSKAANWLLDDKTDDALKEVNEKYDSLVLSIQEKMVELGELQADEIKATAEAEIAIAEEVKKAEEEKYNAIIEKLKAANDLKREEQALKEQERKKAIEKQKGGLTSIDNVEEQKLFDSDVKFQTKEIDTSEYDLINLRIEALNEERRIRQQAHLERMQQYDEIFEKETLTVEESIALEKEKEKVAFEFYNEEKKLSVQTLKLQQQQSAQEIALKELTEEAKLDIANMFFAAGEKFAAENWYISRGFASAQAIVDTYKAANAAYAAMAGIPVVGPALGAAASAAAIAMGLANVHQIWQVDESGKEPTTTSSTMAAATPSFNLADSLPVQYSRNILTDRELDEINKPTKVYLVESELRDFQNRVEIRESNSTF